MKGGWHFQERDVQLRELFAIQLHERLRQRLKADSVLAGNSSTYFDTQFENICPALLRLLHVAQFALVRISG